MNTNILQQSQIFAILFTIYIANIFEGLERLFKYITVSFTDNYIILIREKNLEKAARQIEKLSQAIIQ